MKIGLKNITDVMLLLAVLLALLATPALAPAQIMAVSPEAAAQNPGIAPPNSNTGGKSYTEWAVEWWQYVFRLPALNPLHPFYTTTGQVDCSYGQSGQVWFLVGTMVAPPEWEIPPSVTRVCKVPTGTRLFFPVLNGWKDNTAVKPEEQESASQLEADVVMTPVTMFANIDGMPVKNLTAYRAHTVFGYTVPTGDNLISYLGDCTMPGTCWTTNYVYPAATDGYWLLLEPLNAGTHMIHFGGSTSSGWHLDVTYVISVVPKGKF